MPSLSLLVRALALAAITLPSAAFAQRAARIAIPDDLAREAETVELRGIGGGRRGSFRLGGVPGRFDRSADRREYYDAIVVRNRGESGFSLAASPLGPALDGRCYYREGQLNYGPLTTTPERLAYLCTFLRDGAPAEAELVLEDPRNPFGALHGREERRGVLRYEGAEIAIRSVHRDRRGGLPTPAPIGYLLERDGRAIGAIDVNGPNKTFHLPRDARDREAVLAAGLALSVFWDPADLDED